MADSKIIELKWYALRVFSGHENRVKLALEAEVKRLDLGERIQDILIPEEKVFEVRNGKKRTRVKNFLPGYIIVRAVIDNKTRDVITGIPSVVSFVGTKTEPVPLQEEEVNRILGRVEERKNIETIANSYREGDPVKVIDGPFTGFSGVVKDVNNEKQKVKVEVGILGRKTPVELDFSQIEVER